MVVINALKPGQMMSDAYLAGVTYFSEHKADYVKYLAKNSFGYGCLLNFKLTVRESIKISFKSILAPSRDLIFATTIW